MSLSDLAYRCDEDRSVVEATLEELVAKGTVLRLPHRGPHVYGLSS